MYYRVVFPGKYFRYFGVKANWLLTLKVITVTIILTFNIIKFFFDFKKKLNFYEFFYLNYYDMGDGRKLLFINHG